MQIPVTHSSRDDIAPISQLPQHHLHPTEPEDVPADLDGPPSEPAMPRAFPPVEQNDKTKRANVPRSALSASLVESVAGFSAGVVSCLAAHPLDLLKNRLQLNTTSRSRPGDSYRILRNVIRDEGGVRALYRGLWPNLLGNSLGWGLYFLFYGNLKELFQSRRQKGEHLGSAEFFSASIIAGMFGDTELLWARLTTC